MPKIALFAALAIVSAFALPATALDCSKAKAPDEKALCAEPQALAADDAMVEAYQALSAKLSEADRKLLLQSQHAWIKSRANLCANRSGAEQSRCLKDETEKRRKYLAGEPEAGPSSGGKLVPVIIQRSARKGVFDLDINAQRYAPATTPAERLFNASVDKLLKDAPNAIEDFQPGLTYSYEMNLAVTYASPQFISAHVIEYLLAGGAHGNGSTTNINIDAAKGSILSFNDVIAKSGEAKIKAECMRQILAQKSERLEGEKIEGEELEKLRSDVEEGLRKLEKWSFSPGKATVTYDPYAVGSYAEGPHECEFSTEFLRPFVKAGFVLP
jgi:uncharacterized protein YecT (DUF1311 family)